jgi:integrase
VKRTERVTVQYPSGRRPQLVWRDRDGKIQRRSIKSGDPAEIERVRRKLAAQLELELPVDLDRRTVGPGMAWEDFVQSYDVYLDELEPSTRDAALSRLRLIERVIRPRTLGDVAKRESLLKIRESLLTKVVQGKRVKRSLSGAKSRFAAVLAALRWAEEQGWLDAVPRVKGISTAKIKKMRGRPLSGWEVMRLIEETCDVVGPDRAYSWRWTIMVLWATGLRVKEVMRLHWDDTDWIVPNLSHDHGILQIPPRLQKNKVAEDRPLSPHADMLLRAVPINERHGFVCNPEASRSTAKGRDPYWVGKVIGKIGRKTGIITGKDDSGKPTRPTAHDLRRCCSQELQRRRVDLRLVKAIMGHSSITTTERHYSEHVALEDAKAVWAQFVS